MDQESVEPLRFDGDNSFPDCAGCGRCCEYMYVMACSPEELQVMKDYVRDHDITPIDYERKCCCFRSPDGLCMIWEARPQICRLHHCKVPRVEVLRQNPDIQVDYDKPMVDLYDVFFNGDESDPRYRDQKMELTPLGKAILALIIVAVLAVGALFGIKYYFDFEDFPTIEQLGQLVTTGSLETKTQVSSPPEAAAQSQPQVSYKLLYEEGTQELQLYQALEGAVLNFQEFDADQALTWADAGMEVGSREKASLLSGLFKQLLNDFPCYSVQYPSTPVNATREGSYSTLTSNNRFMVRSLYLQPSTADALTYYQQVIERVAQLQAQLAAESDGTDYDYLKRAFSTLASGMVYSEAGDEGPWYANNIYGAFFGGESECVGMSGAFKALLDAQGIPNFIATGALEGSRYGHAWNVVYYEGAWYVCDLTRCVGDLVLVDAQGNQERKSWQIGDEPQLDTYLDRLACGFMVEQEVYLSGQAVSDEAGLTEYSFGGAITMDDDAAALEARYEALLAG